VGPARVIVGVSQKDGDQATLPHRPDPRGDITELCERQC